MTISTVGFAVLLAGCSSPPQIDRVAWGNELATQGVAIPDWPTFEKSVQTICEIDDPSTFLALAKDKGTPSFKTIETNYKFGCPDRMDKFTAGVASLNEATGAADAACNTPADQRTEAQSNIAEAMSCK